MAIDSYDVDWEQPIIACFDGTGSMHEYQVLYLLNITHGCRITQKCSPFCIPQAQRRLPFHIQEARHLRIFHGQSGSCVQLCVRFHISYPKRPARDLCDRP